MVSSTEVLGERLLKEIASEEQNLQDLLSSLRKAHPSTQGDSKTNIPELDDILRARGSKTIAISGRSLPLVYALIIALLSPSPLSNPGTVAVMDLTRLFSPSHLIPSLLLEDLRHIHVFQPTLDNFQVTLESVEGYMLYGDHGSKEREWKGLFVLGAPAEGINSVGDIGGADVLKVTTGSRGWLRVEKERRDIFEEGTDAEEAWARTATGEVVGDWNWKAFCDEGSFTFE